MSSLVLSRRVLLGRSVAAAAVLAASSHPRFAMAARLSASDVAGRQTVRFDVGDSFVVGHLYLPAGYRAGTRYPAVVIGGSLTAVKEQMGGIYALELAQRGFVALAIDYRHYGESGGLARQYELPEAKAEDLVAAVSYLAGRDDVRADSVALLGACTSGGTALCAAARDRRVAAVACVAGHFPEPAITPALYGGKEGVARRRAAGAQARATFERTGENAMILAYHNKDQSASHVGSMPYYMDMSRGGGVRTWSNRFAVMSWGPWLDFDPISLAPKVTAPTLIVHGDLCALPEQARKAHALLGGPKALHWTSGDHFEFYDGAEKVREAADVIARHFRRYAG